MRNSLRDLRNTVRGLARLRSYIPLTPWSTTVIVISTIGTMVMEVVAVGLMAQLLSIVLGTGMGVGPSASRLLTLAMHYMPDAPTDFQAGFFGAAVILAIGLKNGSSYINVTMLARVERQALERTRAALFARLQHAPLSIFDEQSSAALSSLFVSEARRAFDAMAALVGLVQTAGTAFLYLVALIWISPLLGGSTLVLGSVGGLIVSRLYRHFNWLGREMTSSNLELSRRTAEAFNGVRVVRAANAQEVMAERFERANVWQAATGERYQRASAVLQPILETGSLVIAISLLLGAFTYLVSRGTMSPAKLTAFGLVLLRLVPLVNRYVGVQAHLLYLSGGIREISQWLEIPQFPPRAFGTKTFEDVRTGIAVVGLGYKYRPDHVALDDVSFEIPAGTTVALVGQSGSGKSTLATLLLRLRAPSAGQVLVDGEDYWSFSPESWHRHVALVEQEPFLFNDSLGANVAFGTPDASVEDIEFALHSAYLDDFLNSLPDRLETPIGERGVMLSGGQRQRLSIARAILRNPRLLILDEATSHLDTVSEEFVQAALEAATRGRTTLVIAHRLSTVRRADHIVVLGEGRVVERGTWDELAAADGAFAALLRRGFNVAADADGGHQAHAVNGSGIG